IIRVEDGANTKLIIADEGNDEVTVSGAGTYVSRINGRGGDDTIVVENGAKVDGIVGRWGDDEITITGAGTVVTGNIEGNEDSDTIKILDGAKVEGYVSGGRGESPSVYGGAEKSDGNNITVQNAEVKGNVEGGTYSGENKIDILDNSTVGGDVLGGGDKDEIQIANNSKVVGNIYGRDGDDKITLKNKATVKGDIEAGKGAGEINILDDSLVEKRVRSGIEHEINTEGDSKKDHDFAGNVNVKVENSTVNQSIDLNGTGHREIVLNNSTVHGKIQAGEYSDSRVIVENGSRVGYNILGEGGNDHIIVKDSEIGVSPLFQKDNTAAILSDGGKDLDGKDLVEISKSKIQGGIELGGDDDVVDITESSVKGDVLAGSGNDTVVIKDSSVKTVDGGKDQGYDHIKLYSSTADSVKDEGGKTIVMEIFENSRVENVLNGIQTTMSEIDIDRSNINQVENGTSNGSATVHIRNRSNINTLNFGNDEIKGTTNDVNVYNSTVQDINGKSGRNSIKIEDSKISNVNLSGDVNTINDLTATGRAKDNIIDNISGQSGKDNIKLQNTIVQNNIRTGDGNDKITLKDGSKANTIEGNDGNDTIEIKGAGTVVNKVDGNSGDDRIYISDGAKILREVHSGNSSGPNLDSSNLGSSGKAAHDKIVIEDAMVGDKDSGGNTTTTGYVYTNGASEVIIKNSTVTGDIEAKNPIYEQNIKVSEASVIGGSIKGADGAKDSVTVENSEIKGNIDTRGGDDVINTNKATITGEVQGGAGQDNITVSGGSAKAVRGGDGDDAITVTGTEKDDNGKAIGGGANISGNVEGNRGADTIVFDGKSQAQNVFGGTGNDTITVSDEGTFVRNIV
ncbi:hypothetical protein, partial [Campylobacter sp. RM16191]